jgi:hypothetical protein
VNAVIRPVIVRLTKAVAGKATAKANATSPNNRTIFLDMMRLLGWSVSTLRHPTVRLNSDLWSSTPV